MVVLALLALLVVYNQSSLYREIELGSRDGASAVDGASCQVVESVKIYGASKY